MSINGKRAFKLLKEIGFIRLGGSAEELKAAQILANKITAIGCEAKIEPFLIDAYAIRNVKCEILDPKYRIIAATGYGFSGETPTEGVTGELKYVENCTALNLLDCEGKIVLINGRVTIEGYEQIVKAKAKAFISYSGTIIDKNSESDLEVRNLRDHHLKFGVVPGITIRAKDAFDLITQGVKQVRITLQQETSKVNSHNVVTTIVGSKYPNEEISIFGHYDSVAFSTGVYDNGAGSVIVMELLHHFKQNPPLRTIHFIWFGSEEKGLLGSKAYVRDHDVSKNVLAINIDVGGAVLGADRAMVTGDTSLVNYLEYLSKQEGFPLNVNQSVYSSDSTVYADKGIPAVSFARFASEGGAFIHTRHDVIKALSAESLDKTTKFILSFSEKMINAVYFPIPKKIPQNMIDEVDKYLRKEKPVSK